MPLHSSRRTRDALRISAKRPRNTSRSGCLSCIALQHREKRFGRLKLMEQVDNTSDGLTKPTLSEFMAGREFHAS